MAAMSFAQASWWVLAGIIVAMWYQQTEHYELTARAWTSTFTGGAPRAYVPPRSYEAMGIERPSLSEFEVHTRTQARLLRRMEGASTSPDIKSDADDIPAHIDFTRSPVIGADPEHLRRVYKLVRERVDPVTNIVMYSSITSNYFDMFDNWICSMARSQTLESGGVGEDPHRTPGFKQPSDSQSSAKDLKAVNDPLAHRIPFVPHPLSRQCELAKKKKSAAELEEAKNKPKPLLRPFKNYIIYASDATSYRLLRERGDPVFADAEVETGKGGAKDSSNLVFASKEFEELMLRRIRYILQFLEWGFSVFLNDCDTVWSVVPTAIYPSLDDQKNIDILAQDEMSLYHTHAPFQCTGNLLYIPNPRTIDIWNSTINKLQEALRRAQALGAKDAFNDDEQIYLFNLTTQTKTDSDNTLWMWGENTIPAGNRYFYHHIPQKQGVIPALVHNTWVTGHDRKVRRFKRYGLWFIDENGRCKSQDEHPFPGSNCLTNANKMMVAIPFNARTMRANTTSVMPKPVRTSHVYDPIIPLPSKPAWRVKPDVKHDDKTGLSTFFTYLYRRYSRYIHARRQDEKDARALSWHMTFVA